MQVLTPPVPRGRIGFIVPRWTAPPSQEPQALPYRSLSVAGALYNAGHEVVWFDQDRDLDRHDRREDLRRELRGCRLAFLWMNELDPMIQTWNALRLAGLLKAWFPGIRTVSGGSFISIVPPDGLRADGPIDFFLRGYGEESAPELLEALEAGAGLERVPGLVWRENGAHRANPLRPHQEFRPEHTSLYRVLDLTGYVERGGVFGNDGRTLVLGTARGCAKGCSFCHWRNHEPSLLDPDAIVDLAEHLQGRYGVDQFHLAELDAFASRRRILGLARLWKERLPGCVWFTLASPADVLRLGEGALDLLAEGGLRKLELGTESGSPAMLQAMGKSHGPEDAVELTRWLLARGVAVVHNFVFGLLGEEESDRRRSLALIRRLRALDPDRVYFIFRFLQPTWDTPMGDEAISRSPGYPRTLDEVLRYRPLFGDPGVRSMGWLGAGAERRVKSLVLYFLPMVTSRLVHRHRAAHCLYLALRGAARLRLRARFYGAPLDRWLHDRLLAGPLDNTYTP